MKFEPELRETEKGLEIRLNYQAPDSGKSFSFYVFAANGITQKDEAEKLGKWITRSHVGKENRPAILCHLGCHRVGVRLGGVIPPYDSEEKQQESLANFIAELPTLSGEYGSWWGETQRLLETNLYHYGAFKLSIYYFTNDVSKAPLEWNQEAFENWLKNHQKVFNPHKEPFEFKLIHALPSPESQPPFFNAPSVVKTIDLKELKTDNETGKDNKSTVYLYIKRQDFDKKPKTISEDWKFSSKKTEWVWFCTAPECKNYVIGVIPNTKAGDIEEKDISIK